MTDPEKTEIPKPELGPEVAGFIETWAASISSILTQAAGASFTLELRSSGPAESPADPSQGLELLVVSAGAIRGEMIFALTRTSVVGLGQLVLGESQNPNAEYKPELRDAVQDLFREAGGATAGTLTDQRGKVQMQTQACDSASWSPALAGWLGSAEGSPYSFTLEWRLSSALVASLRNTATDTPAAAPQQTTVSSSSDPPKLDLLLDVELDVVLRFGERSMLLREILELDAGSVVDLNREVSEAADLLIDGRVIARGEVVVVDGNYGLKILEIAGPGVNL